MTNSKVGSLGLNAPQPPPSPLNHLVRKIRYLIWICNFDQNCPYCGRLLKEHGFNQQYDCLNPDCDFSKKREAKP